MVRFMDPLFPVVSEMLELVAEGRDIIWPTCFRVLSFSSHIFFGVSSACFVRHGIDYVSSPLHHLLLFSKARVLTSTIKCYDKLNTGKCNKLDATENATGSECVSCREEKERDARWKEEEATRGGKRQKRC